MTYIVKLLVAIRDSTNARPSYTGGQLTEKALPICILACIDYITYVIPCVNFSPVLSILNTFILFYYNSSFLTGQAKYQINGPEVNVK
jgi:hypothetical protein